MIVVDSSAVLAILFGEKEASTVVERLVDDLQRVMSVANYIEAGTVLAGRRSSDPAKAIEELDAFLTQAFIQLAPVEERQARTALEARLRFGKGFGSPAGLNYGDCFAYALAKTIDAPLLFIGDDFGQTDVRSAL